MKYILVIILLLSTYKGEAQHIPSLLSFQYDSAIAYTYYQKGEGENLIHNQQINPAVSIIKKFVLTPKMIVEWATLLSKPSNFGGVTKACFIPRFSIVFFRNKKCISWVHFCLECNSLESSEFLYATHYYDLIREEDREQVYHTIAKRKDKKEFDSLEANNKILILHRDGFSKKGRKRIKKWLKQYME